MKIDVVRDAFGRFVVVTDETGEESRVVCSSREEAGRVHRRLRLHRAMDTLVACAREVGKLEHQAAIGSNLGWVAANLEPTHGRLKAARRMVEDIAEEGR